MGSVKGGFFSQTGNRPVPVEKRNEEKREGVFEVTESERGGGGSLGGGKRKEATGRGGRQKKRPKRSALSSGKTFSTSRVRGGKEKSLKGEEVTNTAKKKPKIEKRRQKITRGLGGFGKGKRGGGGTG